MIQLFGRWRIPMAKAVASPKKTRTDGQITSLAGEFLVAGELLKRELQVALTLGNAKAIDMFAHNQVTGKSFSVQVKALRAPNYFPISHNKVKEHCMYVFVVLNKPGEQASFYIVPGKVLRDNPERFGKYFLDYDKFPGIHSKELVEFKDKWQLFHE
jgi:hypothetical protein